MVMTASPWHASEMRAAGCAPSSSSGRVLSGLRLNTVTSWPAFSKFAAIAEPMRPSPINPVFISISLQIQSLRSLQRRHELGTNRVGDRGTQEAIDFRPGRGIDRPARHAQRGAQLLGA